MVDNKYKRVLLKISGEALLGDQQFGIDPKPVEMIADEIRSIYERGVEIAVVVGGGNIFRGMKNSAKLGMDQASGDYVGMLATVMNAVVLQCALKKIEVECRVQTAIAMNQIAEPYVRHRAIRHLEKGRVVIFAAGTGNPFFTTDTASALRASEINAEVMLMAKNGVDGIYDDDPKTNPNAKKIDEISYADIIKKDLRIMDTSACALCKQNNIPIIVFDFKASGSLVKIMNGESVGTYVSYFIIKEKQIMSEALEELFLFGEEKMEKAVGQMKRDFASVRTGRANPGILDKVLVDYYGVPTQLRQMSQVTVSEGTTLVITPYDKTIIKEIEKAIIKAEIGVAPNSDGTCIRLNFPPLTEERRKETAKEVKKYGEDAKIAIRNVRRDMVDDLKKIEKEENLPEDMVKDNQDKIQKLTDKYVGIIDSHVSEKEKEVMTV